MSQLRRTRAHVLSYAIQTHPLRVLNQNGSTATTVFMTQGKAVSFSLVTSTLQGAVQSGICILELQLVALLVQIMVFLPKQLRQLYLQRMNLEHCFQLHNLQDYVFGRPRESVSYPGCPSKSLFVKTRTWCFLLLSTKNPEW